MLGNVLKTGIQVAIVGKPNSGNQCSSECPADGRRAIVSEIPVGAN